jgi:hypothetical protein
MLDVARSSWSNWMGYFKVNRTVPLAIVLIFLGLLICLGGYLLSLAGYYYSASQATYSYPNGWAGAAAFLLGMILWLTGLVVLTRAVWNPTPAEGGRPVPSLASYLPLPPTAPAWAPSPSSPTPQYPGLPLPPPPAYPPGVG